MLSMKKNDDSNKAKGSVLFKILISYSIFGIVVTISRFGKMFKVDDLCEVIITPESSIETMDIPLIIEMDDYQGDYVVAEKEEEYNMTSSFQSDLHPEVKATEKEQSDDSE